MRRVLCISLTPKEGEQGCGGTLNKLATEGNRIYYATISYNSTYENSMRSSLRLLGVEAMDTILFNEPPGYEKLLEDLGRAIGPDIVFIPSGQIGRRYKEIAEYSKEIFKYSNLLAYELPTNNFNFVASCFSALTESQIERKCLAVSEYASNHADMIRPLAKVRGVQIKEPYAEAFEVLKLKL